MGLKPGDKHSEVGPIPEDWEVTRLGDIADFHKGTGLSKADLMPDGTRHCIHYGQLFTDYAETITQVLSGTDREGRFFYSQRNDVLMPTSDVTPGGLATASCIMISDVILGGDILVIRALEGVLNGQFLAHRIRLDRSQVLRLVSGTTVHHLYGRDMANFIFGAPPADEQTAIVSVLSDVDALINSLDRLIAKKRDIKQATMQRLLIEKARLPGFSGEWEVVGFGGVLRKLSARNSQIQTHEYADHGPYPVIDQGKPLVVGYSDQSERVFRCRSDGVIVFGDHTRIVKFIDFDFVVGADGTQLLMANRGYCTRFLYYQLSLKEIPNTGYNRHFKFLTEMQFFSPSLPEQRAIATVLSDMDAEIAALERRRDKTRALKQGMMQELLTGRTRLV